MSDIKISKAKIEDAPYVVEIFNLARGNMVYLPILHTPQETIEFLTSLVRNDSVWIAKIDDTIVGFMEVKDGWFNHLYISPKFQKMGIGKLLLDEAKRISPKGLFLMVFEDNKGAIKFYEREGFKLQEKSSKEQATNEEHLPDRKYYWSLNRI